MSYIQIIMFIQFIRFYYIGLSVSWNFPKNEKIE